MTRIASSNYGAQATTIFQWATTDDDLFDRELDLYHLSQAVELHDHSSGRGLAVARLSTNAVTTISITALAVTEDKINTGAVTNGKIGAGAVTRDKITWPLAQPSNDMTGGFRMRETSNTYAMGFYIAANGLAVFGAGTSPATIGTNLILGQAGQVSVGTTQGAGLFNVMQAQDGNVNIAAGLRIYNSNTGFFGDIVNHSGHMAFCSQGTPGLWIDATNKFVTIGATINNNTRLTVAQAAGTSTEGFRSVFGGGESRIYVDAAGHAHYMSASTDVIAQHGVAAWSPATDQGASLGQAALRWGTVFAMVGTFSTSVTIGTTLGVTGNTTLSSATISTLTISAGLAVNATSNFNATLISNQVRAASDNAYDCGDTSQRWRYVHVATGIGLGMGTAPSALIELGSDSAKKPSTNTWQVTSDSRVKYTTSIHNYTAGLQEILALQPVHYRTNGLANTIDMRGMDEHLIGFVADDAQKIASELVSSYRGRLDPEDEYETDILTVNTHALPFMLINAVKELTARIEALESRRN